MKHLKIGSKEWFIRELDRVHKELKKAKKESDVACQALHEYRDVVATECDDDWHDARGPLADGRYYTGKRAEEALKKMPKAVKRRNDAYIKAKNRLAHKNAQ